MIAVSHTIKGSPQGTLHIRKCPLRRFREFVMTVGYEEFVRINILEATTMRSLFKQFVGTYRKESDDTISNLKIPEADDMKIEI